jgi:hypothetical protein
MIGGLIGDTSAEHQRLSLTLYRLLAQGAPVSRQALAEAGAPDLLAEIPDSALAWEDGCIVAYGGLDLRPSDHVFDVAGCRFHTWCVFDGLFLPEIIARPATLSTHCPATDTAIEIEVEPGALASYRPAKPVMSIVAPEIAACARDLRGVFCRHVRFFADRDAFLGWAQRRDDVAALEIDQAYDLARRRNTRRFAAVGLA